jgi:hypothetical protein
VSPRPALPEMTLRSHANRPVAAIPANIRLTLALDAEEALTRLLGIHVAPVPQLQDSRGAGGWCDGLSLTVNRIICYAPSPGSRRQNFTLLHELGHLCVNDDDDALDWLADRADPSGDLERLCDAIAAEILLPLSTITQVLSGSAPQPGHLRQLYTASRASEEVCAIALAAHLPSRGAITLIHRRTATVAFAAGSGWPPLSIPRGLTVPPGHPLRDLGTRQRWSGWTTPDLRLAFSALPGGPGHPSGSFSPECLLEAQAEAGPRRTTAILLDTTSHPQGRPQAEGDADHGAADVAKTQLVCLICGHTGAREHYPCPECGVPPCPACGRCPCL